MITLALVDDHVILRESLAVMIQQLGGFTILFEAGNGQECIDKLTHTEAPDIILLDIAMPVLDGIETARWLKQNHPATRIIVLSMLKNELLTIQMLRNGARAYLPKDADPDEFVTALYKVYDEGYYYNGYLTVRMTKNSLPCENNMISSREISFMRWACTELTHKEIAREMNVSPRTIDSYRDSLFRKLEVNSRIGIVMYAIRSGLFQI